jgi:hypothetical protein
MHYFLILILSVLFLSACANKPISSVPSTPNAQNISGTSDVSMTTREAVFFKLLTDVEVAAAYERYCLPESKNKTETNPNLYSNLQFSAAWFDEEVAKRLPESIDHSKKLEFITHLTKPKIVQARKKINDIFEKESCDSNKIKDAQKRYVFFSAMAPASVFSLIDKRLNEIK